ncbi:MAG: hypothetical protein WD533_06770 [Dehalococcoidia bacterium]
MDHANHNPALEDAKAYIGELGPLKVMAEELREYPVSLLRQVCEEYAKRESPVPDHVLTLPPYIGETALRALIEGGLLERSEDQRFAIHAYRPTDDGQEMVRRIDGGASTPRSRRRKQ